MPPGVVDPDAFMLTSDFPLDMVIYLKTISFLNDGSGTPILISHGLPFTPLVDGSWDLTPSFDTNYDYFSGTIPSPAPNFSPFAVSVEIAANATDVVITPFNITGIDQMCYTRIFGFEPSDSNADLEPTASSADDFILNTDNNYTKLYLEDFILNPANDTDIVVNHPFGKKVQVRSWVTNFGYTEPTRGDLISLGRPSASMAVVVTDTQVIFRIASSIDIERIDYRIYLDQSGA